MRLERERVRGMEELTEDERRALRGSKFAPLPSGPPPSRSKPRLPHPGGPLTTNKASALAKFLERKLQEPNGLASIKPELVELAVKNAKDTVNASKLSGTSHSGRIVRHVDSFADSEDFLEDGAEKIELKQHKKKKKKKKKDKGKNKKQKASKDPADAVMKMPKKKLKL